MYLAVCNFACSESLIAVSRAHASICYRLYSIHADFPDSTIIILYINNLDKIPQKLLM